MKKTKNNEIAKKPENGEMKKKGERYILKLFVAGITPRSTNAILNLKKICREYMDDLCDIEIIDIYQQPDLARKEEIFAAPTLIKKLPLPLRKFIGDLSDTQKILVGFDIIPKTEEDRNSIPEDPPGPSRVGRIEGEDEGKRGYNSVLMADDDEDDCNFAKEAFLENGVITAFSCVEDGVALLEYLSKHSRHETEKLPNLILLDLNMPRKDGRQVLKEIKSEATFRDIPIVVLTTSSEEKDIRFAKKTGAELFITKPSSYSGWVQIMKSLAERWLKSPDSILNGA